MKKTVFCGLHEANGGKMVEFAGFYMPVQFEGVNAEHETVRKGVGVFDVSHMGEFWIKGPKAFELVQRLTSNDVAKLDDGKIQYTCFPNDKSGIVDDLLTYRFDAETYLLVVNAANIDKDWAWVVKNNIHGATIFNASDEISQLAIQGPKAQAVMQKLTDTDLNTIPYYTFKKVDLAGVKQVILSNTGYTGAGGFEVYMANSDGPAIWKALMEAGAEFDIKPIGLAARDTLRLEMGFCLYGNDINDTTSPLEAGLGWITKFADGNDFINRPALEKQKSEGLKRMLRGFEMIDKGIPRQHYEICDENGRVIGEVTSGTMSPSLKIAIGMGYVETAHSGIGNHVFIRIREKLLKAIIVKIPFYKG
ncbi:MAG TPA: glycine cleavage system aminomethyltransferase GcvT [Bacteroidales bacterium]|nr:glycine cleavage system aminomethyltransferase GcvT [Bacteroidales bacterium]HPI86638.1 glycine cleavage system aminomethyltransferase GcvT [Bacteroidales bacterium]HPM92307.1 glycine cleavage system aminomethyltransferase GcvT [Bacteroidales bacterium]